MTTTSEPYRVSQKANKRPEKVGDFLTKFTYVFLKGCSEKLNSSLHPVVSEEIPRKCITEKNLWKEFSDS
jgi:hypothetical protein